MPIGITSVGGYVPPHVVDNAQIGRWAEVSEDWIQSRTGILQRRYGSDELTTSDMATRAARPLLEDASLRQRVGVVILAPATRDQPQPATATFVQGQLGLHAVPAFDVNAVCSGFLFGMAIAEALLTTRGVSDHALVIGADKYSTIIDRADRRTVSLFGDGAGAVLLGPVPDGYGIQGASLLADGRATSFVRVEAGGTRPPLTPERRKAGEHLFRMEGRSVRDWGLQFVPKAVHEALHQAHLTVDEIDRAVFHQGNTRLVYSLADEIGIEHSKLALTAPCYGNTAAASIPLTLKEEHAQRPLQRGDRVLLASVGGGMTAAAMVLTWY
ncbi:3-oxoacyl-ACP synthase [Streptomyces rimosus]|uniref:3-oxoacyl-ACP synthase III family protein n=1 Tax=Streptomyces rimosus TaxID=1927 RepID=UPI0004D5149F|nr:ketoacyl-ACP synthase III [Streptomyces rimosus]KEF16089.1 3-oxoacyl-ACP synthase [Streptomyces rimosus]